MSKKPHLVKADSFDDAQEIADRFRCGEVVAVELAGCEYELVRRLIDFSSGVCYAGGGALRKVGHRRYLLLPPGNVNDLDEGPDNSPWDPDEGPDEDPDRSPLGPGGPPPVSSAAVEVPVADWIFTDAVSTTEVT
jgi:hypothetical protein